MPFSECLCLHVGQGGRSGDKKGEEVLVVTEFHVSRRACLFISDGHVIETPVTGSPDQFTLHVLAFCE